MLFFSHAVASEVATAPLPQIREHVTNHCINILHSYRKFCATVSSSSHLVLPEALKILPLYTLGMSCIAFQPGLSFSNDLMESVYPYSQLSINTLLKFAVFIVYQYKQKLIFHIILLFYSTLVFIYCYSNWRSDQSSFLFLLVY